MPGLGYFEIGRKLHGASSRAVAIPSRSTLCPLSGSRNDLEKIAVFLGIHDIFYLTLNVIISLCYILRLWNVKEKCIMDLSGIDDYILRFLRQVLIDSAGYL